MWRGDYLWAMGLAGLLAAGAAAFVALKKEPAPPPFFPGALAIEGTHDSVTVLPDGKALIRLPNEKEDRPFGGAIRMPDGSEIRFQNECSVQFAPPDPGDRGVVELWYGDLEFRAAGGKGRFRLVCPAGEIRFAPSHCRVRGFSLGGLPFHPSSRELAVLTVEVMEGKVELTNTTDATVSVAAGEVGLSCAGFTPISRKQRGDAGDWIYRLSQLLRPGDDLPGVAQGQEIPAAFLLASLWGTTPGEAWDWKKDLEQADPKPRRQAALLAGIRAPAGGWELLERRYDAETDEATRLTIAQALACIAQQHPSGERDRAFLTRVSKEDGSEKLRAWAKGRLEALDAATGQRR